MVSLKIPIPQGFTVEILEDEIVVTNSKGTLKRKYSSEVLEVKKEGEELSLTQLKKGKMPKSRMYSFIGHVSNIFKGLTDGFEYKLTIVFSHFPMTIKKEKDTIEIANFLGGRKIIKAKIVGDTSVEVKGKDIILKGIDKEAVGQTASNIERSTRITDKDRRRFQDGVYIVSKMK